MFAQSIRFLIAWPLVAPECRAHLSIVGWQVNGGLSSKIGQAGAGNDIEEFSVKAWGSETKKPRVGGVTPRRGEASRRNGVPDHPVPWEGHAQPRAVVRLRRSIRDRGQILNENRLRLQVVLVRLARSLLIAHGGCHAHPDFDLFRQNPAR